MGASRESGLFNINMMTTYATMSAAADDNRSDINPSEAAADDQSPASYDLGTKLAQRLREHTADRDRTQRRIDQESVQLQHLSRAMPKRPRETKMALQQKAKQLERDRTSRSLPLAKEKALIRQIDSTQKSIRQHSQVEQHQLLIRKKKVDLEACREELRTLNVTISEIETALSNVELGKKLGCLPSEVITRDIGCPMDKINWVLGKDGSNIKAIEEGGGVKINVDRIRGKIQVRGFGRAVEDAVLQLENFTKAVDEEMKVSSDLIAYLFSQQAKVLNKIRADNPDVRVDVLSKIIMMRGHPDTVQKAKEDFASVHVISQSRLLVGRETALIIGKTAETIHRLSEKHFVVTDVSKDGADKSILRIIGPSKNVEAAMAEVDRFLYEHDEIEESILSDPLLKTELLHNAGVGIKEFQRSVSTALAAEHPEASGVLLVFDKNSAEEACPMLLLKCSRCVMGRAKNLVTKKIEEFESNIVSVEVSKEVIPVIIGKGGATINELRKEGKGALVEAYPRQGVVKLYSNDATTKEEVLARVRQIIAENQVAYVPIEKASIGFLFGDPGKYVRKACADIGCSFNMNKDDTKLVIKGTNEQIKQVSEILNDFLTKNYIVELDIGSNNEPLLFLKGPASVLHQVEAEHDVRATFRKGKNVLQVRGELNKVHAAMDDIKGFLNGGDGVAVCKFNIPEQAIGGVIGKGGSNIAKLEADFEGVFVHVPKDNSTISIRGPEDLVKQCRTRIITTIATTRVSQNIDISPQQHEELSNSAVIKQILRFTNAQITLNQTFIKVRGVANDVRDAKANIDEHLTGTYHGYVDLEGSQFGRVETTVAKDPTHFERIQMSTGAVVALKTSVCAIHIFGRKSGVKKAKSLVMELLNFMLPGQLQTLKIHRSLFKSMADPGRLSRIATQTGASISLDRDLSSVLVRSDDPKDCDKALVFIKEMLVECQKLNAVIRLESSEAWILSVIVGKGGASIKQLEKETECSFEILKDEVAVIISGETVEVFLAGREALERVINQARKECIFIDLPESCMAAFIGKGGAGIKQLAANNDVQIERTKKHPGKIKITGTENNVACARNAVLTWLEQWEASNIGIRINLEEHLVPLILGKGGEIVRSIQKETRCKIDLDRQNLFLTVRNGSDANRRDAVNKVQAIIDEENAKATQRAVAKVKFGQEQEESAARKANSAVKTTHTTPKPDQHLKGNADGTKDRSGEFVKIPVGFAPVTNGDNDTNQAIHGKDVANRERQSHSELGQIGKVEAMLLEARLCLEAVQGKISDGRKVPNGQSTNARVKARDLIENAQETMTKLLKDWE